MATTCANCGSELREGARACRECGSDDETGWAQHATHYGALPSDSDPVADDAPRRSWRWLVATVVMLVAFVAAYVGGGAIAMAIPVAAGALGLVVARLLGRRSSLRPAAGMRELMIRASGDAALASRLVDAELARRPDVSRDEAIRLAIAHLDHDRR